MVARAGVAPAEASLWETPESSHSPRYLIGVLVTNLEPVAGYAPAASSLPRIRSSD